MEVLFVLIVLFIAFCTNQYFYYINKGPWHPKPLPVPAPQLPERKEIVQVPKKSMCRRCVYIDKGECLRGVKEAPKVFSCELFVNRKSPAGRQIKKELREMETQMPSCEGEGLPATAEEKEKKTDRSEIILSNMEK